MARKPEAELELNEGAQEGFARVQRVAWAVLVLAVVAVLLGAFGGTGFISTASMRSPDGALEIHYQRLARRSAPATLEVRVAGVHVDGPELRLGLDRKYLEAARIERITPAPLRTESGDRQITFVLAATAGTPALVVFQLKMDAIGLERARVTLAPDRSLEFTQFIYP